MGWFNRKPKYEPARFFTDAEGLRALIKNLDYAWEYGLTDGGIDAMIHGLPIQINCDNEYGLFRVYLNKYYVEALEKINPSLSIRERYGVDHNSHRSSGGEDTSD